MDTQAIKEQLQAAKQARQAAVLVAQQDLSTASFLANEAALAAAKAAAAPQLAALKATADAAVAAADQTLESAVSAALGTTVGSDVIAGLSGGRTRKATIKAVTVNSYGELKFTLTVQGVTTPGLATYEETVDAERIVGPYSDSAFLAAKLFKAGVNLAKGRGPDSCARLAGRSEKYAYEAYVAAQEAAAKAAAATPSAS